MPNLSLANTITSKPEHRQLLDIIDANFSSSNEGFAGIDATLGVTGKRLSVLATDDEGYARQNFTVTPGITYSVSFKWIQVGGGSQGAGQFKLGSTNGGIEYVGGEFAYNAATTTQSGLTFVTTGPNMKLRLSPSSVIKYIGSFSIKLSSSSVSNSIGPSCNRKSPFCSNKYAIPRPSLIIR